MAPVLGLISLGCNKNRVDSEIALGLMKDQGYQGFVSLEWTKRWHPELAEPGVVFSHFIFNAKRMWERA